MQTTFTTVTGAISTTYRVELGSRGPQGIQGPPNILSIGTVTTGAPGSSASASISGTSPSQTLDLEIPRGDVGPPGPTDYNLLTNVPATFPPSAHTHVVSNITPVSGTHLIGRHAGGSGNAQEVSVGNGVEFQGSGIRRSALTGDVTASAGSNATTIANDAVTTAKIINDAVTNGKLANMATETIKGRTTAGTGDPEDLTPAQARTVIGVSPALVVSDTAPTTPVDGQQWLRLTSRIFSIWSSVQNRWITPRADVDLDLLAYFEATGATDTAGLYNLVAYIKNENLWSNFVCYPMKSAQSYGSGSVVRRLGGLTTNDMTLVGTPTWTAGGIDMNDTTQFGHVADFLDADTTTAFVRRSGAVGSGLRMAIGQYRTTGDQRAWGLGKRDSATAGFDLRRSPDGTSANQELAISFPAAWDTVDNAYVGQFIDGGSLLAWKNKTSFALSSTNPQTSRQNSTGVMTVNSGGDAAIPQFLFGGVYACAAVVRGTISTTQRETITDLINAL